MANFKFVGGARKTMEVDPDKVLAEVELGERKVVLIKDEYPNRRTGGVNHVVKMVGIGNPTTFGAEKHLAWMELQDAITEHFISVGQIEPDADEDD